MHGDLSLPLVFSLFNPRHLFVDGYGRLVMAHILAATTVGFIWAVATRRRRRKYNSAKPESVIPRLDLTGSGHVGRLEKFSDYVARQIGFRDGNECPELSKLASDYARSSKSFEDDMYLYFSNEEQQVESLSMKLVEELERCILGYFAFHWSQASLMINQVLSVGSDGGKLKNMVLMATRKQRFERVTKYLKVTRAFSTMVEEMKAVGFNTPKKDDGDDTFTELTVPMACDRSPVLLFMGGGMGAGKSTVLKEILKEGFWLGATQNPIVVEADAFKETDVIYQALSSNGHHDDMLQTAELVHQTSIDAASSLLVTALNEGRDVIMDGTLSWEPFVEQTIAMVRAVHKHRYRMGAGYKVLADGTIIEDYWERAEDKVEEVKEKKPYRIELVGVVCDPYLAVTRGIRRAIAVKRAVRVNSQLKSHKRFANAFIKYCSLVDNARLYCTNGIGVPPTLIEWKDGNNNMLNEIKCLETLSAINDEADSIYELYANPKMLTESGSAWKEFVLKPDRKNLQRDLKVVIERIEKSKMQHVF